MTARKGNLSRDLRNHSSNFAGQSLKLNWAILPQEHKVGTDFTFDILSIVNFTTVRLPIPQIPRVMGGSNNDSPDIQDNQNGPLSCDERRIVQKIRAIGKRLAQERSARGDLYPASASVPILGNSAPQNTENADLCFRGLHCIQQAIDLEPALQKVFPALNGFVEQQRAALSNSSDSEVCRKVDTESRNALAQLASQWGYNHPRWLAKALNLIGYRLSVFGPDKAQFETLERATRVLGEVFSRAVQVGNELAVKVAKQFVPPCHLYDQPFLIGGNVHRFIYFFEMDFPLALRLARRSDWALVEFALFARCFGESAAFALKQISPAHNCNSIEVKNETDLKLFSHILKVENADLNDPKQVLEYLHAIASQGLAPFYPTARQRPLLTICPLNTFPAHKLRHVPFRLLSWLLQPEQLPPSPSLQSSCDTATKMRLTSPGAEFQAPHSVFGCLGYLLYLIPNMAEDIKKMSHSLLTTTEDKGTARLRLQRLIDRSPVDKSVAYHGSTQEIREGFFDLTCLVAYLIAHLYDVHLRICGALKLPKGVLEENLSSVLQDLQLCGLPKLPVETHIAEVDQAVCLSLSINSPKPWRGEIFLIEHSKISLNEQIKRLNLEEGNAQDQVDSPTKGEIDDGSCALSYYCRELPVERL